MVESRGVERTGDDAVLIESSPFAVLVEVFLMSLMSLMEARAHRQRA